MRVPNGDWIAADRKGLTICDATSAAFAQNLDWPKLDVVTFSWQKALGGEGAHGMIILGPRAAERLTTYTPAWPLPKLFRLAKGGKLTEGFFEGETINTPSMLCVEDYIDALQWAKGLGGAKALFARADANAAAIAGWVEKTPWIDFLATVPQAVPTPASASRSLTPRSPRCPRTRKPRSPRRSQASSRRRRSPTYRFVSRRSGGPAHLVRRDGQTRRHHGSDGLARLRFRGREGEALQGGGLIL